jgi:protein SCO1
MATMNRQLIFTSVVGMLLFAVAAVALEKWQGDKGNRTLAAPRFPNVELTTQHGHKVRLYDDLLQGKAVAVNTFFAGCLDVCPLGTAKMLELQRLLGERVGKDIFFYSLSVDPHDTPAAMKAYAERYGLGPGWLLLTGKEEDIARATQALGLGVLAQTNPRESHSTTLMVGREPTGQWMKTSATDNPRFIAASVQTFLGWPENLASTDYAKAAPMPMGNGEFMFRNACAACHTIGGGDRMGPDLAGVNQRRDSEWLEKFIVAPERMRATGDPTALALDARFPGVTMPNLHLARDEVRDILDFIDERSKAVAQRKEAAQAAP